MDTSQTPETLENILRVTRTQESVLNAYYTDTNGEVVTMTLYDISETGENNWHFFILGLLFKTNQSNYVLFTTTILMSIKILNHNFKQLMNCNKIA